MTKKPLVSVIIPTYNRANKLGDAINSVYLQTYKNIQLIVVDDGSTDNTDDLISMFPDIEYIKQEHAGQAAARNNGLHHSFGQFIASLDSDDIWDPEFLERCVDKLQKDELDFVFANWTQDTRTGTPWEFLNRDPFLIPYFVNTEDKWINLEDAELRKIYIEACPSPSSSLLVRKSSIVSGWDEKINVGDDWCMYLDIILNKECRAAFTLDKLWRKRLDTNNIYDGRKRSELLKAFYIADISRIMQKFEKLTTAKEMTLLKRKYVSGLVELSKHELVREYNFKESFRLLKISIGTNIIYTMRMIPELLMIGLKRKYEETLNIKRIN